jgi:D-alanine transaminase
MLSTTHPPSPSIPDTICYLNGDFCPLREAKISVLDRGFIFGDGIYEVVPIYYGQPFRFDQHMARLERSLAELRIPNPHSRAEWLRLVRKLVDELAKSSGQNVHQSQQIVYIQISRGVAPRDHAMTPNSTPTVFMMTNPFKPVSPEVRAAGVKCVSAHDFRWEKAHIKSTSLLGAVLSRQLSADVGATETIMFRGDFLSEASSSNVWVVKGGAVYAPPKDHLLLEGIRYGLIEEICKDQNIAFELKKLTKQDVFNADEILLSSATKEVLPVSQIDEALVGLHTNHPGKPGPVYKALHAAYQACIDKNCKAP